jgi:hypothetical protein
MARLIAYNNASVDGFFTGMNAQARHSLPVSKIHLA